MIDLSTLLAKVENGGEITREEAIDLYHLSDLEALCSAANSIRKFFMGEKMDTCSIINARSGICSEDCAWCSQSVCHTTGVAQYDIIDETEAIDAALINEKYGVHRFSLVTASRAFPKERVKKACDIYRKIHEKGTGKLHLCASMGLLDLERMEMLKQAGVTHYHINMETSRRLFPKLVTKHTYDDKLQTMQYARQAGIEICSGGIIGMGETVEDRIDLAMEVKRQGVKSIPINILNPIKGTPLENTPAISPEDVLRTIAVFRFINPQAYMRFAGGRLLIAGIVEKAFQSGMNGLMVGDMLTTLGSKAADDFNMIQRMGFTLDNE
ncbi:MAG: biotin synthase BioB [Flavobacteriales bacterium]|nr:biotin synthase BioB [Flavobacteriales bacterium]